VQGPRARRVRAKHSRKRRQASIRKKAVAGRRDHETVRPGGGPVAGEEAGRGWRE